MTSSTLILRGYWDAYILEAEEYSRFWLLATKGKGGGTVIQPFRPHFGLKIRGGSGPRGPSPGSATADEITGNAFRTPLQPDWQIDNSFFNRPITARPVTTSGKENSFISRECLADQSIQIRAQGRDDLFGQYFPKKAFSLPKRPVQSDGSDFGKLSRW